MISIKKETKYKIALISLLTAVGIFAGALSSNFIVMTISKRTSDIFSIKAFINSIAVDQKHLLLFLIFSIVVSIILIYSCLFNHSIKKTNVSMRQLADTISIPNESGNKQHGSARFATESEQDKFFKKIAINSNNDDIKTLLKLGKKDFDDIENVKMEDVNNNIVTVSREKTIIEPINITPLKYGGIPSSYKKIHDNIEEIKLITGDVHSVCFGATRSGKSRTLVIQSIVLQAMSGVDIVSSDPKGELYQYTFVLLKRLGYKVFALDFKNPKRSVHYNFLQYVINACAVNDISKAISCCWDFVDCIVKEAKSGDPLWTNGEKAILAAATMQVVYDNSVLGLKQQYPNASQAELEELYENKHKKYQNCINLFNYISKMSVVNPQTEQLVLADVINMLPDTHPAKLIMAIAETAPSKTRGSFITSALASLRLFTDPNIADITSMTDDGFIDIDTKKAIFIILPDAKQTYYSLASLFVNQYYQYLAEVADDRGGRLPRDCEFNLDEFGNFSQIPFFDGKMTVGAGRGIHFHLYVQSKDQLNTKYDKETANIILGNCHYWIYLKSEDTETKKMLEEKIGKYTVLSTSSSASLNDNGSLNITTTSGSTSTSTQLMARSLMTADEIGKIERPYILIFTSGYPSLLKVPDLHKWQFNQMLGLGDEKHNIKVRAYREAMRDTHNIETFCLWDFLSYVNSVIKANLEKEPDMIQAIEDLINDNF